MSLVRPPCTLFELSSLTGLIEPRGWDVDKSHTIPLFSYHNAFALVDQSLTCGAINGNFRIGGNVDADFTVTIGVTAEGSFFPPDVDEFKAYASEFPFDSLRVTFTS
jgi:hypothetical protein